MFLNIVLGRLEKFHYSPQNRLRIGWVIPLGLVGPGRLGEWSRQPYDS